MNTLSEEIQVLEDKNKEALFKRLKLESEISKIEILLTTNWNRRREELTQNLSKRNLKTREQELTWSENRLADVEERLIKIEDELKKQNDIFVEEKKKVSIFFAFIIMQFIQSIKIVF